ncbi:hypothetical protein M9Y10_010569 [Tritrichomonas musculus]|uniref:Uncharacterized protein n=1 Tax=Tritrichomonas musculus TaxID=1915356 RepID=A0ABR2INL5_9EUKA
MQSRRYKKNFKKIGNKDFECKIIQKDNSSQLPLTYNERLVFYTTEKQKKRKNEKIKLVTAESSEKFWNSPDDNHSFNDGVIINKSASEKMNKKALKKWNNLISSIQKVEISENQEKEEKNLFCDKNLQRETTEKLYKLFSYDEEQESWTFNDDVFLDFSLNNDIITDKYKVPLILFSNSSEEDIITINSKLIDRKYPELDDEGIYVYAFCDRILSFLNYEVDFNDKEKVEL